MHNIRIYKHLHSNRNHTNGMKGTPFPILAGIRINIVIIILIISIILIVVLIVVSINIFISIVIVSTSMHWFTLSSSCATARKRWARPIPSSV